MRLGDIRDIETPEEFHDCEVLYENGWSDYEEYGWIIFFKFFDEIMKWEYNYSVFAESYVIPFDPYEVSEETMKSTINVWENG